MIIFYAIPGSVFLIGMLLRFSLMALMIPALVRKNSRLIVWAICGSTPCIIVSHTKSSEPPPVPRPAKMLRRNPRINEKKNESSTGNGYLPIGSEFQGLDVAILQVPSR